MKTSVKINKYFTQAIAGMNDNEKREDDDEVECPPHPSSIRGRRYRIHEIASKTIHHLGILGNVKKSRRSNFPK